MIRILVGVFVCCLAAAGIFLLQHTPVTTNQTAAVINSQTSLQTPIAEDLLDTMSLEEKVGQMFMIGHWREDYYQHTMHLLQAYDFGGVIIMKSSDEVIDTIPTWTKAWQEGRSVPLLISIDQEGGVVSRLQTSDFIQTSQRELTTKAMAHTVGAKRGSELHSLGINMNLAPVLDFASSSESFLYERSFADLDSGIVYAEEIIDGHKHSDVIVVPKHFPGHPDNPDDSHNVLPILDISIAEFPEHILPFTELLAIEPYQAIMTAHVLVPALDPVYPTTLSSKILTEILREDIGYQGVIMTDDMTMGAITNQWSTDQATIRAIEAGANIILFAADPDAAITAQQAVLDAVAAGTLTEGQINQSVTKILTLKQTLTD